MNHKRISGTHLPRKHARPSLRSGQACRLQLSACYLPLALALALGLGAVALTLVLFGRVRPARAGGVIYVDADATGAATGLNWTDAYTNVQDALAGASGAGQIWVAEGVYYPDEGGGGPNDDLTSTFTLENGVALYGGFSGGETQLDQRNPVAHVTVLSGDLEKNDLTDPNGVVTDTANIVGANAYHVVTGGGTDSSAVLDGFTITAGQATGSPFPNDRGGGMFNGGSSPTLTGLTFSGNEATDGGGMANESSSPILTNVTFSGNSANSGGGMSNEDSHPVLNGVDFTDNSAVSLGGGISNGNGSAPNLTGGTFSGNSAFSGGGMNNGDSSSPNLADVTFEGNSAVSRGGGMFSASSSPELTDVTFISNTADFAGGGMANNGSSATLSGVTFSGNSAVMGGGGLSDDLGSTSILTDVTFTGNSANFGGGMSNGNGSSPTLTGVAFIGNNAANDGGGMNNNNSSLTLTNISFSGNSAATNGGGMANSNNSNVTLTNLSFSGNSATNGGGINQSGGTLNLTNVILWGDMAANGPEINIGSVTPSIASSDIQGCGGSSNWDTACGMDNGNNIDADPLFLDADGVDNIPGTLDDDLSLSAGSPAIDTGDNNVCPPTDLLGLPRPFDGDDNGQADCDMGAFEFGSVWHRLYLPAIRKVN